MDTQEEAKFEKAVERAYQEEKAKKKEESWWDVLRFAVITLAIIIPFRIYVAQPFIVSGDSMFPTFHDKEYLIVDELSYHFHAPNRGDVVIFKYPLDTSKFFIKRIIGLPGETVTVKAGKVYITKDEQKTELHEPYLKELTIKDSETKLAKDQYFTMGDNRDVSFDSRYWGALDIKFIRGRALMRLLPLNQLSYLPGKFNQYKIK